MRKILLTNVYNFAAKQQKIFLLFIYNYGIFNIVNRPRIIMEWLHKKGGL